MRIYLEFASEQPEIQRKRMQYAFAVFCAIYGHQPVGQGVEADSSDLVLTYSAGHTSRLSQKLQLSNGYRVRNLQRPAPPPSPYEAHGERTFLFYPSLAGVEPDWLGEIFEWISCADEYSDSSSRKAKVPFGKSYIGRHGLDPKVPHAAVAMHFLQRAICGVVPACSEDCVSPVPGIKHFIVNTHDVDFLPLGRFSSVRRMLRNSAAALGVHRQPRLAFGIVRKALATASYANRGFGELSILVDGEELRRTTATYFFIANSTHRRDGNYRIDEPPVLALMRWLEEHGMEVAVHGSYCSLSRADTLPLEFSQFRDLGFRPVGNRQHWLRFTLDCLIPAVENAGGIYDASLGWADVIGFRAGACFPFPPYNFTEERPARFLEMPLALMDVALIFAKVPILPASRLQHAEQVLSNSRRYGWGGISVLWHSTGFGGGQIPAGIGDLFWHLLDESEKRDERWLSGADFMAAVRKRYAEVGLCQENEHSILPAEIWQHELKSLTC